MKFPILLKMAFHFLMGSLLDYSRLLTVLQNPIKSIQPIFGYFDVSMRNEDQHPLSLPFCCKQKSSCLLLIETIYIPGIIILLYLQVFSLQILCEVYTIIILLYLRKLQLTNNFSRLISPSVKDYFIAIWFGKTNKLLLEYCATHFVKERWMTERIFILSFFSLPILLHLFNL